MPGQRDACGAAVISVTARANVNRRSAVGIALGKPPRP